MASSFRSCGTRSGFWAENPRRRSQSGRYRGLRSMPHSWRIRSARRAAVHSSVVKPNAVGGSSNQQQDDLLLRPSQLQRPGIDRAPPAGPAIALEHRPPAEPHGTRIDVQELGHLLGGVPVEEPVDRRHPPMFQLGGGALPTHARNLRTCGIACITYLTGDSRGDGAAHASGRRETPHVPRPARVTRSAMASRLTADTGTVVRIGVSFPYPPAAHVR